MQSIGITPSIAVMYSAVYQDADFWPAFVFMLELQMLHILETTGGLWSPEVTDFNLHKCKSRSGNADCYRRTVSYRKDFSRSSGVV